MRAMRLIEPAKAEYSWRLKFFDHLNLERKISFKGVKGKTSESKKRAESYRASIETILLDKISNRPMSDESFKFLSDNPAIAAKLREWDIIGTDAMGSTETLTSLMQKWVASRKAHGLKKATIVRTTRAVREGIRGCKWTYISDIDGDELLAYYLNTGICANTAKSYLYDFKNFASWLVDQGYVRESPLRKTKGPKVRGKVRENIELPVEIEAKLYQYLMSPEAPRRNKTAPKVRALVYQLGSIQGLRAQEVVKLTCEDVHLNSKTPCIAIADENEVKTKEIGVGYPDPARNFAGTE